MAHRNLPSTGGSYIRDGDELVRAADYKGGKKKRPTRKKKKRKVAKASSGEKPNDAALSTTD